KNRPDHVEPAHDSQQRSRGDLRDADLDLMRDQMSADQAIGGTAADEETAGEQPESRMAYHFTRGDRGVLGGHATQRRGTSTANLLAGAVRFQADFRRIVAHEQKY